MRMESSQAGTVFRKSRRGMISLLILFGLFLFFGLVDLGLDRLSVTAFGAHLNLRSLLLAMCEAGMVGGIADWYAVTCLFRSPFGIDSPHTRLLPRKKNEIARGLTNVIKRFLPREVLAEKVGTLDYSRLMIEALNDPHFRSGMKRRTADFIRGFLENVRDQQSHRRGLDDLVEFARRKDLASALAVFLQDAVAQGIFESVLPQAARMAESYVRSHRSTLEAEIDARLKERVGWFLSLFVNAKGKQLVDELLLELVRVQEPGAVLVQTIKTQASDYSTFVLTSASDRDLLNAQIHGLLDHEEVQRRVLGILDYLLLEGIKFFDAAEPGPADLERLLDDIVTDFAQDVAANEKLRQQINVEIAGVILGIFYEYNLIETAANWIRDEIQKLSDEDFTRFVEEKLYNDLQFIRVSGAVTGSIVGGVLYLFKELLLR